MLIVDAHEDLAANMLEFGRDYTRPAAETRRLETGGVVPERNGDTLLGWAEYQRGRVALVFATLFVTPAHRREPWEKFYYRDISEANRLYRQQVDIYHRLVDEHADMFRLIQDRAALEDLLAHWERKEMDLPESEPDAEEGSRPARNGREPGREVDAPAPGGHPVGMVMLMEGAEGVRTPQELEEWRAMGVRLIGPAWAGTRFCGGTRQPGPLTSEGFALLEAMGDLGFVLDVSHMDEQALMQALDVYPGRIVSSHANAQSLVKNYETNRHLSDLAIRGLLERDAVLGVVPFNNFLLAGWKRGDRREEVPLSKVADQIDYICQMAGDARHAGIGSDFDGGFGVQSTPPEIDTIADLRKLAPLLAEKGYSDGDIAAILGGNWIEFLTQALPEAT